MEETTEAVRNSFVGGGGGFNKALCSTGNILCVVQYSSQQPQTGADHSPRG